MDILWKKFKIAIAKHIEEKLLEIQIVDKKITKEVEDIKERSKIVDHKLIFFKRRIIDRLKIDKKKINELISSLDSLAIKEREIKINFSKAVNSFKHLTKYDKNLKKFLINNTNKILEEVKRARDVAIGIKEMLNEFGNTQEVQTSISDDFEELEILLKSIRKFTRQLYHYFEFWETRTKVLPYIKATIVIKTDQYKDDVQTYKSQEEDIYNAENKIETWPEYSKKLHEVIKNGLLTGKLHARINRNLRIIYYLEKTKNTNGKEKITLTYERILTHTEFDRM